jgi:hypothetical protein
MKGIEKLTSSVRKVEAVEARAETLTIRWLDVTAEGDVFPVCVSAAASTASTWNSSDFE